MQAGGGGKKEVNPWPKKRASFGQEAVCGSLGEGSSTLALARRLSQTLLPSSYTAAKFCTVPGDNEPVKASSSFNGENANKNGGTMSRQQSLSQSLFSASQVMLNMLQQQQGGECVVRRASNISDNGGSSRNGEDESVTGSEADEGDLYYEMLLGEDEIKLIRDTFQLIKGQKDEVAIFGIRCVVARLPHTIDKFRANPNVKAVQRGRRVSLAVADISTWEMEQFGTHFLSTIERCILRLNRPHRLRTYLSEAARDERSNGVSADDYALMIASFEEAIMNFLRSQHGHSCATEALISSKANFIAGFDVDDDAGPFEQRRSSNCSSLQRLMSSSAEEPGDDDLPHPTTPPCLVCTVWLKFFRLVYYALSLPMYHQ